MHGTDYVLFQTMIILDNEYGVDKGFVYALEKLGRRRYNTLKS